MATMIIEVYEALKAAGVPEDKARAAAASVLAVTGENAFGTKAEVAKLKAEFKSELQPIKERLVVVETAQRYLQWWIGAVGLGVLLLVVKSLRP